MAVTATPVEDALEDAGLEDENTVLVGLFD